MMTAGIEKKIEEIKKMLEAYNALAGMAEAEEARSELEEAIIEAAFDVAEMYEEEEDEDSWCRDLKIICEAYETLDLLSYKWDWDLTKKGLEMRGSIREFMFAIVEKMARDEVEA